MDINTGYMYEESKNSASSSNNNNNNHNTMNTSNSNSGAKTPTEEATSSSMNPPPLPVSLPTMTNTTITAATATVEGTGTASLFEAAGGGGQGRGGRRGPGQGLHGDSGGNHPNSNNTSRNSTAVGGPVLVEPPHPPSSSSSSSSSSLSTEQKDIDNHNGDSIGNTTDTTVMTTLVLSTSSSSSPISSARSNTTTTNFFTPTAVMSNLVLLTSSSSSPVTASMVPTGIVTEKNKTLSEAISETTAATAAEISPPSLPDPQDECVLCCYPLPNENGCRYQECCGEVICFGCFIAQVRTLIIGTNVEKPIAGSEEEEREFRTMMMIRSSEKIMVCPFCRAEETETDAEKLKRLWERIDEYNDPKAMFTLGVDYMEGTNAYGVSKNLKNAEKLLKRSYDLGYPAAAFSLSVLHRDHVLDEALELKYLEEGARRGELNSIYALARRAGLSGSWEEATRQFMMAARSGHNSSMHDLIVCYQMGKISKDDLDTTLRAHKAANDAEKSEARKYASRYYSFGQTTR